tara:strand:- start:5536 stop:6174 length:639 start_codon:yes stop_codon:yes gene_type:complete
MHKKYKSIIQKNSYILFISIYIITSLLNSKLFGSGAYDKGSSTGKGRFELSITLNPFGIVPYGQNYAVLSYGLGHRFDIVSYYSSHKNGTQSQYFGSLFQFFGSQKLDLATAIGLRHQNNGKWDIFAPQILYNYKLSKNYNLGGSLVKVIDFKNNKDNGNALDITLYRNINNIFSQSQKIKDAYFGIGVFKNTEASFKNRDLYLHYSLDLIF